MQPGFFFLSEGSQPAFIAPSFRACAGKHKLLFFCGFLRLWPKLRTFFFAYFCVLMQLWGFHPKRNAFSSHFIVILEA
jgi:hypothetical protein